MNRMKILSRAVFALALWSSLTALNAEPFLYVSNGGGSQLVKVDVGAGTTQVIGPLNQPGAYAMAISSRRTWIS